MTFQTTAQAIVLKNILLIMALLGTVGLASKAFAQETGTPGDAPRAVFWAVLDTDQVFAKSKAMKTVYEQMAKIQADNQARIDVEKAKAKKEEEALLRKRNLLSPEALADERKKFQDRIVTLQRQVQETNQKLNKVRGEATKKVSDMFLTVVMDVVKLNNISMVFQKSQMVFADPKLDITEIVIKDLDTRLPSVQVATPSN